MRGPMTAGLVGRLRAQAVAVLSGLVPAGSRCALVDFPAHGNVGDSAIWLGERAVLAEIGAEVVYVADAGSFSPTALAALVPERSGVVLLHGGGNLGDLWPVHQRLREEVVSAFPTRRVVQLPQSAHFGDRGNLDRARAVFDAHPDLTLLARDHVSLGVVRGQFRARSLLCPDLAFAMAAPARRRGGVPAHEVVWLARGDHEGAWPSLPRPAAGVLRTDWTGVEGADAGWVEQVRAVVGGLSGVGMSGRAALCDRHAGLQVLRGCGLLGRGRVVVTDRLHAHVLSLLLGLPHVVLGDRHAKVRGFWETWTRGWPGARWADDPEQALALALGRAG